MDDAIPVSTRLRRTTPYHDAYTVRVYDERLAALATARPADARRWVATTRWLHGSLLYRGRLIVGLGVQWTPTRAPLRGDTPVPATLQLCVGHRCLVFHLARADAVPEALRRFIADPRVTFVGSGSAHDGRMLWEHYGLVVARGRELRAVAGMGNASVEQMADRFLGYPGICKPREVSMSAWHAPRLSLDQVQYASVDAYLAFRLGVVLLCPGAAAPPPPPARAQQRAPVQRVPAIVDPAPRAPVVVHAAPPVQRAPAVVRQAPAPVVVIRAAPPAFFGVPVPAMGGDAAITGGKVMGTHAGVTDDSDTESEIDSYDDVYRAATRGLHVRAYASDSDYSLDSSDGFEDVRFGAFTDEEDEEDDGSYAGTGSLAADDIDGNGDGDEEDDGSYAGTGSLAADDIDGNGDGDEEDEEGCDEDDQDDEEEGDCNEDDQADEEGCNEDDLEDEEGCNQNDEEGYNEDDQEGYNYTCGAGMDGSAELVSNEVVIDGCEEDGALAQDDWYDQEVDYGYDQEADYGFDQDDEQEFEEFYLL